MARRWSPPSCGLWMCGGDEGGRDVQGYLFELVGPRGWREGELEVGASSADVNLRDGDACYDRAHAQRPDRVCLLRDIIRCWTLYASESLIGVSDLLVAIPQSLAFCGSDIMLNFI